MEIENKIHDIQSRQNDKEDVLKMIKERLKSISWTIKIEPKK